MLPDPVTPIRPGSPYSVNPPLFEEWNLRDRLLGHQEQRSYCRRSVSTDIWLIDGVAQRVVRCKLSDACDAGLRASSPIGYGLAVGQRYEVRIAPNISSQPTSPHLGRSLGFATIVRIELEVEDGDQHRIGFAAKFDVPQLLPV